MEETKIVLATKSEHALYLFKRGEQAEFVVAYKNGDCRVGDFVESWICGHYFYTLEDAVDYFKTCK